MNLLVIDIQGFKIENNKFIVKELAAFDGKKICHYIFKAPFDLRHLPPDQYSQAVWLMNNHHCIPWIAGFTPTHKFSEIIKNLTEKYDIIYVKGKEKAEYIGKYSAKTVIEFEENPSLQPGEAACFYHSKLTCICALRNVYELYNTFLMT